MGSGSGKAPSSFRTLVGGLLITVPFFGEPKAGVQHFFGTRHSRVKSQQKSQASMSSGLSPKVTRGSPGSKRGKRVPALVSVKQVHGTDVLVVDDPDVQRESFSNGWDGLVTNQPGVLLTVRTADCVPVLLFDPNKRLIGAVHAGWRGAVGGIVINALQVFQQRFGADVGTIRVGIGPSVGPCCYEVDTPVLSRIDPQSHQSLQVVAPITGNKAMLDLKGLIRQQVEQAGVATHNISVAAACTYCHPDLFYSYRREGVVKETMVSGIMLASPGHA